ncbi:hypothetical protein L6R50_02065 [Myxococcota bacterium]|nr:hypothetical protein [Myxococcota bacterium]
MVPMRMLRWRGVGSSGRALVFALAVLAASPPRPALASDDAARAFEASEKEAQAQKALYRGDATLARDLAREALELNPSSHTWLARQVEIRALERLGLRAEARSRLAEYVVLPGLTPSQRQWGEDWRDLLAPEPSPPAGDPGGAPAVAGTVEGGPAPEPGAAPPEAAGGTAPTPAAPSPARRSGPPPGAAVPFWAVGTAALVSGGVLAGTTAACERAHPSPAGTSLADGNCGAWLVASLVAVAGGAVLEAAGIAVHVRGRASTGKTARTAGPPRSGALPWAVVAGDDTGPAWAVGVSGSF